MGKKIEVLLLKPLPPKGNAGDVIEVKAHYAQHVLIPNGRAVLYTQQVKNQRAAQMKQIEKNKAEIYNKVKEMIATIEKQDGITFTRNATETGSLYDSITSKILTEWAEEEFNIKLAATAFVLEKIEEVGDFEAEFHYKDITTTLPIHVVQKVEDEE